MQSEIKLKLHISRFFEKAFCRLFIVIGALAFLQFPLFMHHYKAHLKGHVDELKIQVDAMQKAADMTQKNIEQYIAKFLNSTDIDFAHQGALMNETFYRYKRLSYAYFSLDKSSVFTRPFIFISALNYPIFKSTLESFSPGFILTYESIAYSIIGILVGYSVFLLSQLLFKKLRELLVQ
jgi:hypothetical protein